MSKGKGIIRKRYLVPAIIVIALVILRLFLPLIVRNYLNDVLARIHGHYGQVDDIDLDLFLGSYVLHGLYLNKVDANSEEQ